MPEPTKNPIAGCLDALGSMTLFKSQDDTRGNDWTARQCIVCSPAEEASPKIWRYRLAFALFLFITTPLVLLKLLQTDGQAGLASAQAAGGDGEISSSTAWMMFTTLSGGIGATIIALFTRLQCMIETFSGLILPHSSISREKQETALRIQADKTQFLTTPPKKILYWLLRGFFLLCSITSVAFKAVNGGLFGLILALQWLKYTSEEIDQLKTGDPQYMPEGNGLIYSSIVLIGTAAFISSFIFDIARKARAKSHDATMSFMCQGTGTQRKENPKVWWAAFCLGLIYSACSVAVAYVSTSIALTVFSVWALGNRYESAIKWISLPSASTSLFAMMLSAGSDTHTMFEDILLKKLPWHFRYALNRPFTLTCFGYSTPQIANLRITIILSMVLLGICGICDTYNNTAGTAGSLQDVFIKDFNFEDNAWTHGTAWTLAILSAFTYIANTLWIALKVEGNLWGIVPGKLITDNEGLSLLVQEKRLNYSNLDRLISAAPTDATININDGDRESDDDATTALISEENNTRCCCPCL